MTEKRFADDGIEDIENQSFTDNLTGKTYWIDNGLDEIVNLLNDFNDDNERLKANYNSLSHNNGLLYDECTNKINALKKENEQLKDALNQRTEQCDKYYEENEQLKKGMIRAVDRYIKNVDCNPPSSAHTYMKIKGALLNIREDLRDLIGDLDG